MTTVVLYSSTDAGAPVLNAAAGSLIALLDACLLTGYGTVAVSSITVAAGVATVQAAGHGFAGGPGRHVDIVGATPAALSGRKAITLAGAAAFTYAAPGVPDGTYTGGISARRAAAGWSKEAAGTNVGIYRRPDPVATSMVLRVQHDAGQWADVRSLEAYSDVNTWTGGVGGASWLIGANDAAARAWHLIVSPRGVWFLAPNTIDGGGMGVMAWFDLVAKRAGDAYHCATMGDRSFNALASPSEATSSTGSYARRAFLVQRGFSQLGAAVVLHALTPTSSDKVPGAAGAAYPDPVSLGLDLQTRLPVLETSAAWGHPVRGYLPGVAFSLNVVGSALAGQVIRAGGRDYICLTARQRGYTVGEYLTMPIFFDLTGPWY